MYRRFITFLEEHNSTNEFYIEFERQNPGYHLDENLWDILGGDEYFLARAFDWSTTREGRSFWARLDSEWNSACMNHIETTSR